KEYLVELVVIVLASMDDAVVAELIELRHYARQPDDLRARAEYCHDTKALHFQTSLATVSGRARSKISFAHSMTTISPLPTLVMSCVQPGTVSTIWAVSPDVKISCRSPVEMCLKRKRAWP